MPRNRRNGSLAAMDPLFISGPKAGGNQQKASRHHPPLAAQGVAKESAARRFAISGRNGTGVACRQLPRNYTPMQLIARLRFFLARVARESLWKFDGMPDGWQARRVRPSRVRHNSLG